jgi:hypothetical protein
VGVIDAVDLDGGDFLTLFCKRLLISRFEAGLVELTRDSFVEVDMVANFLGSSEEGGFLDTAFPWDVDPVEIVVFRAVVVFRASDMTRSIHMSSSDMILCLREETRPFVSCCCSCLIS